VLRCVFNPWIRDSGWVKSLDSDLGSYFIVVRNHFLGLKHLNSLMRIRDLDQGRKKFGSGMENIDLRREILKVFDTDMCNTD
jgi:hypothetical protein